MTVLFTDAFSYSPGNLSGNGNWLNVPAVGGQQITIVSSNAGISGTADDILCRQTGTASATAHVYVQATIGAAFTTGGVGVGMGVALSVNTAGLATYVRLIVSLSGWELARFNGGAFTSLGSGSGTTFTAADKFRFEYNKSTGAWALYKFTGASPGASFATGTDPSPLAGNQFGVCYSSVGNSASGIDDFEFGDFASGATTLTADKGTFTLTGIAATLKRGDDLVAAKGTFTLTGIAATLKRGYLVGGTKGTFTETGIAAALQHGYVLGASRGTFVLTGNNATLAYSGAGAKTLTAATGPFTLTGIAAALERGYVLGGTRGQFVETGIAATLKHGYVLTCAKGQFLLTGQSANLIYSGATPGTSTDGMLNPMIESVGRMMNRR